MAYLLLSDQGFRLTCCSNQFAYREKDGWFFKKKNLCDIYPWTLKTKSVLEVLLCFFICLWSINQKQWYTVYKFKGQFLHIHIITTLIDNQKKKYEMIKLSLEIRLIKKKVKSMMVLLTFITKSYPKIILHKPHI